MRLPSVVVAQFGIFLVAASLPADAQTAATGTSPDAVAAPTTSDSGGLPPPQGESSQALREPGDADAGGTIHLHMPAKRVVVHHHRKPAAVAKVEIPAATSPETPAPAAPTDAPAPVAPQHKAAKKSPAAAPSTSGDTTTPPGDTGFASAVPFSFVTNPAETPSSPPAPTPPPRVAKASPPPAQSLAPEEGTELKHGLARQSQILFAPGAPDPSSDALDAIRGLAGPLNTALAAGASRIQVVAYGGNPGDRSSDARRLSLKRALSVRQLLIEGGVA